MHSAGTFAWLLAPTTVADFFSRFWETAPLHVCRDAADYYGGLLSVDELDRYFLANNLSPHFLRVIQEGRDCPWSGWTRREKRKNTDPYLVADVEQIFSLFRQGASIVINAGQTAIPSLAEFCRALEPELKVRVQPNVYISPPRMRGLDPHFDPHDVFILQIRGAKEWQLYDYPQKLPVRAAPIDAREYLDKEPQQRVLLRAGDLLYLPRGTVHCAGTTDQSSVHVTVGLMSRYWFHLVEELARLAESDAAFRRTLPHGLNSVEDQAVFAQEFKERLKELVSRVEVATLLERCRAEFVASESKDRRGRFADLLQVSNLGLDSVIVRRTDMAPGIEEDTTSIHVQVGREEISFPLFLRESVRAMLSDVPFAVREIAGPVTDTGKLDLARRFVEAGLLRVVSI
jgi:JmjC domain